jgi:hypothetical protein
MKLMLFCLCLARTALAEDFRVEVDPHVYGHEDFANQGVVAGNLPPRVPRPDALPNKRERDAAFARVPGLAASLGNMDELERDLLYVRAKTRPLADLKLLYPKIPAARLARLKQEAKDY